MDLEFLKAQAERYLELMPAAHKGVVRELNVSLAVPSEVVGAKLRDELAQMGYTKLALDRFRPFLFKRWYIFGISTPVEYTVSAIHQWLDSLAALAGRYDATVATWTPRE